VALVAVIISIIQMAYIPIIMSEKEADHMDVVENQFSQLKSVIEIQSMMGVMGKELGAEMPIAYSPISSPITLGTKRLPYFVSQDAKGSIKIIDEVDSDYHIDIPGFSEFGYSPALGGIPLTCIEYTVYNHYYLDGRNLQYILEGGAIILNQSDLGETMKVAPSISVDDRTEEDTKYITINWDIPIFVGVEGKKITPQYYTDYYIRTNYTDSSTASPETTGIEIFSKHLDLWYEYFTNENNGLLHEYMIEGNDFINVEPPDGEKLVITSKGGSILEAAITVIKVGAQTGAGIIVTG
jgi:hypothetical protein